MRLPSLHTRQKLPVSLNKARTFFLDPSNLNTNPREGIKFQALSGDNRKLIIPYIISPFRRIQMQGLTEIPHGEPHAFLVDEQRFGLYKLGSPKHFFRESNGSIKIEDLIHDPVSFGCIRNLLYPLLVRPNLKAIYDSPKNKPEQLFNSYHG